MGLPVGQEPEGHSGKDGGECRLGDESHRGDCDEPGGEDNRIAILKAQDAHSRLHRCRQWGTTYCGCGDDTHDADEENSGEIKEASGELCHSDKDQSMAVPRG